jgi:MoxR-like ATPase
MSMHRTDPELRPEQVGADAERILAEVERAVVGKADELELVLTGFLAKGHVLIEDYPGLAKTLIARSFAQVLGLQFSRIQFTPDLMPADVTGASIYDPRNAELLFRPGPVFAHLVLGDEINRAPPKTQSALLEAMAENQVTADGETRPLPNPFLVVATENPIEFEGTYPLPEAQLDRFMMRLSVGYPSRDAAIELVERRLERRAPSIVLDSVVDRDRFRLLQDAVEAVHADGSIVAYVVDIVEATRRHHDVEIGASPRGALALITAARARAAIHHRDFVTPEDVKTLAAPCLAHRLGLRPELWVRGIKPESIVQECLGDVAAPPTERPAPVVQLQAGAAP